MQPWECQWILPCVSILHGTSPHRPDSQENHSHLLIFSNCLLYDWWVRKYVGLLRWHIFTPPTCLSPHSLSPAAGCVQVLHLPPDPVHDFSVLCFHHVCLQLTDLSHCCGYPAQWNDLCPLHGSWSCGMHCKAACISSLTPCSCLVGSSLHLTHFLCGCVGSSTLASSAMD